MAVALRVLMGEGLIGRAITIDLDLHQGNGTADIHFATARLMLEV